MGKTLLPRWLALPVFCSDPLSSNAYATEEILLVLSVGGLALLHLTPWVAAAVIVLLMTVVISYRQTCRAYPNGGGAYAVTGSAPVAKSAHLAIAPSTSTVGGLAVRAIVLRAFAAGRTALTGVEAVSNGVPSFRIPKSRNAASARSVLLRSS